MDWPSTEAPVVQAPAPAKAVIKAKKIEDSGRLWAVLSDILGRFEFQKVDLFWQPLWQTGQRFGQKKDIGSAKPDTATFNMGEGTPT